ncbi:MAG: T9SS type A sorting domain-containing protein [Bacteroidetes bacterium]|nr:T9SS type A sorting domain-containing protein [Bacteroidota bacterium]
MKNLVLCLGFILFVCSVVAFSQQQVYWTEGFEETVWPTSSSSSEANVSASTGTWKVYAAYRTTSYKYTGSASLQLTTGSYFITPIVSGGIKEITFYSRSTGSARPLIFYVSTDGVNFTQLTTGTSGSSAGFIVSTVSVNNQNAKAIKVQVQSGGTAIFDDVTLVSMITPTITVSHQSLPDFGAVESGTLSGVSTYTVSGTDLTEAIVITAPAGFEVSLDGTTFTQTLSISPQGRVVPTTTIFVRFRPTSALGTIGGAITHTSSGATTKSVTVTGRAIAQEPSLSSTIIVTAVTSTSITLNFSGGSGDGRLVVARRGSPVTWVPTDGMVATGVSNDISLAVDHGDGNKIVYDGSGSSVTVTQLLPGTTYYFALYEYNGLAANAQNYLIPSTALAHATTIEEAGLVVEPSTVHFGRIVVGTQSSVKSYLLSGVYLTPQNGTVTVTAPEGFKVSLNPESEFTTSLSIPYTNQTLQQTTVYVRFIPTQKINYSALIRNSGGGAREKEVAVSGEGVDSSILNVKTYYVSPQGNDANPGTFDAPFYTLAKAIEFVQAGDTVYVRGGKYNYNTTIRLEKSGTAQKRIHIFAYPGEFPELDFSTQPYGASYRAILLKGNYWYIKGLEIHHAGDNGIKVEGSYNIIERCTTHHCGDTGIQLGFGHIFSDSFPGIAKNDGTYCAYNLILNCDSYYNYDPDSNGGDADGFACKMHNGIGNVFRGCRAWYNSDDGWDLFETDFAVVIDSCWTWKSGIGQGNGNGFKLGGDGTGGASWGTHIVTNSIAFGHKVNGFTNNSHKDGTLIVNCLSFSNGSSGYNYFFEGSLNTGKSNTFKNCVGIPRTSSGAGNITYDVPPIQQNNSWNLNIIPSVNDYIDLSEAAAMAPRLPDGSLPRTFAQLKPTSSLIDKGVNVGLPYYGVAPDLGPFEYVPPTVLKQSSENIVPENVYLSQNYPNPFNPSTTIHFGVKISTNVTLRIYDALGKQVRELFNGWAEAERLYSIHFYATGLATGMYYCILQSGNGERRVRSMLLLK